MRRWWMPVGALVGVLLLAAGLSVAVAAGPHERGPAQIVRDYFAAVRRSDAPAALGYGTVPPGPRTLLTSKVLRAQHRIAPLQGIQVLDARQSDKRARVTVRYTLGYEHDPQTVTTKVGLHRRAGHWRLDAVAVSTRLVFERAVQRARLAGVSVPDRAVLLFPGAVPVGFDSDYLESIPDQSHVELAPSGADETTTTSVAVQLSETGLGAVDAALLNKLRRCLRGGDPSCPLPTGRYVPGSIHATIDEGALDRLTVIVAAVPSGRLDIEGPVTVEASSYQRLSFRNVAHTGHGELTLQVAAHAYPVAPLHVFWDRI